MDNIVGLMFCKNEADIIKVTIPSAMQHVDSMFISDDGSTDGSWEIIQYFKQQYPDKIEHIQQKPNPKDQGQRQDLLDEIRRRYKPENTWVQTLDADMTLGITDLRSVIAKNHRENVSVKWALMNAVRDYWEGVHHFYPHWPEDIRNIMNKFHRIETIPYTYRPLPGLYFPPEWRPWPKGFGAYMTPGSADRHHDLENPPLMLHYGYRGPTHMMARWNRRPVKPQSLITNRGEDYTSVETINATNLYFNGTYNRDSRYVFASPFEAWKASLDK